MRNESLFFALLLIALGACSKPAAWTGSAPDFSFSDLGTGKSVQLSSYAGKPVVLNFWADW